MSESKAMKEIHEIRVKNYEDTKNMSSESYIQYIKKEASKSKLRLPVVKKSMLVK